MKTLLFILTLISCGQDYNSNSSDKTNASTIQDSTNEADKRRLAATSILEQNCFSCHSWSGYKTDKLWVDAGFIIAGNAADSELIKRLINSGGDMPQGGSALTNNDATTLTEWINGVK